MPISGPTSYFVTTQAFINHWTDANAANGSAILLSKTELGLAADLAVAGLTGYLTSLEAAREVVENTAQDVIIARATAAGLRAFLHVKMSDFNERMRADFSTLPQAVALAELPQLTLGRDAFMRPMRDTARLWLKVNTKLDGDSLPPLVTRGGYTQAMFNSAVLACRQALDELEEREQQLTVDIGARSQVEALIYPALRVYRAKIPTVFADGHQIITSLPKLTPESGSTPNAPGLSLVWNPATNQAEGTGTASSTAAVTQHQLRGSGGPDHNEATEVVLATIEAGQPLVFNTTWGLATPGSVVSYRLVAMTGDGHERGSPPVVITRPLP